MSVAQWVVGILLLVSALVMIVTVLLQRWTRKSKIWCRYGYTHAEARFSGISKAIMETWMPSWR